MDPGATATEKSVGILGGFSNHLREENFFDSSFFTNTLAALIGCFALTQTIGYMFGWYDIEMLGKALMFSPMPRPFSALEGFDTLASTRTYTLHFSDGRTETLDLDDLLAETITGPHRREIPYMQTLRFGPELPRRLTQNTIAYLFCDTEVYERFTSQQPGLEYLTVQIHLPRGAEEATWEYPIRCTP